MSASPTSLSSSSSGAPKSSAASGMPPDATYAGIMSFMRRPQTRELAGVDVVVSGIPLDLATTFRPGSRFGPAAIRAASAQLSELKPFPWGVDPFETLKVVDYGDCWFDAHNPLTIRDAIVAHARTILASGARMLTFGGDHYITYPLLRAHAEKYGKPLSLIHFDAHTDTWPDEQPDSLNHGTMFYKAVREGLIDPARSVQVGIRTWNDDTMGIKVLSAPWVHQHGVERTIETILSIVGDSPTYLTFDIDCLDPAFAPGTGTPVPGGLTSAQALEIIRSMTPVNLMGADVVEVAPAYDHAEITGLAAAHIAADLLCVMNEQKLAKGRGQGVAEHFERSRQRYPAIRPSVGEPNTFRLKYREALIQTVQEVIRGKLHGSRHEVEALAQSFVAAHDMPSFVDAVQSDLDCLYLGNVARFRLRLSEYEDWPFKRSNIQ